MSEFDMIKQVFAPLAAEAPVAFDLTDDAALTMPGPYVVTKDMMVSGVHCLPKDPLDLVARKLLRVNLSDLAAKGAKPVGYFLGCVWPAGTKRAAIEQFADGLREDQASFRVSLFGGDTTVHATKTAPLTLSLTALGMPSKQGMTMRSTARVGDDLYVSGTIGDAMLGLRALKREEKFTIVDKATLAGRYHLPEPRLSLGAALAGLATAALDVSDGLLADATHLGAASEVAIEIDATALPLSEPARDWVGRQNDSDAALAALASAGDDYEILFTAPTALRRSVEVAAKASRTRVQRIGVLKRGEGLVFRNQDGEEISVRTRGYDHFK